MEITTMLSFDKAQTGGGTYISVIGRRVHRQHRLPAQDPRPTERNSDSPDRACRERCGDDHPEWADRAWRELDARQEGASAPAREWNCADRPRRTHLGRRCPRANCVERHGQRLDAFAAGERRPRHLDISLVIGHTVPDDDLGRRARGRSATGYPASAERRPGGIIHQLLRRSHVRLQRFGVERPDGTIVSYGWTFGDGQTGTGQRRRTPTPGPAPTPWCSPRPTTRGPLARRPEPSPSPRPPALVRR